MAPETECHFSLIFYLFQYTTNGNQHIGKFCLDNTINDFSVQIEIMMSNNISNSHRSFPIYFWISH